VDDVAAEVLGGLEPDEEELEGADPALCAHPRRLAALSL
jgi:hypothetical protein